MKNLNKNTMMQEMSLQEMKEVNGGIAPLIVLIVKVAVSTIVTGFAAEVIYDSDQAAANFQAGYNSVRN